MYVREVTLQTIEREADRKRHSCKGHATTCEYYRQKDAHEKEMEKKDLEIRLLRKKLAGI